MRVPRAPFGRARSDTAYPSPIRHHKQHNKYSLGSRSRSGLSSVVRCPPSRAGRAAVARRRLRPRRCRRSVTLLSGSRSRCRPPVSRLRTPPSLCSPFALGRAPRSLTGAPLPPNPRALATLAYHFASSPPTPCRSLRQKSFGVRSPFCHAGWAGSSYLAACPFCVAARSRSGSPDPR